MNVRSKVRILFYYMCMCTNGHDTTLSILQSMPMSKCMPRSFTFEFEYDEMHHYKNTICMHFVTVYWVGI